MYRFLIYIIVFIIMVFLQSQIIFDGIVPDFLLIFFVFLIFKKIYFLGISLLFTVVLKIFSSMALARIFFYWFILEIIVNTWKRTFMTIHKSVSFFLIISLSVYSYVFWKIDYKFDLNYLIYLLKYIGFNLIFFLPFYFFIPEFYSNQEEK